MSQAMSDTSLSPTLVSLFGVEVSPPPMRDMSDLAPALGGDRAGFTPVRFLDISGRFPAPQTDGVCDVRAAIGYALHVFAANEQKSSPLGRIDRCVIHWTAGAGLQVWDDYHYNIAWTGSYPVALHTCQLGHKGEHLWHRNTGAAGFTFCSEGPNKVYQPMVEMMGKLLAEFCHKHGLNPLGKTADGFYVIDDHAAYARHDGYYPDRWDVSSLMVQIRAKAAWYHQHLTVDAAGKYLYEFGAII